MSIVFHPHPVPCRNCGTILEATFAAVNGFCCPECDEEVCYTCGCVSANACTIEVSTVDGPSTLTCEWTNWPGACSFCLWRAAYEFYQEVTDRPSDDPFYTSIGREPRGFKGLDYGV